MYKINGLDINQDVQYDTLFQLVNPDGRHLVQNSIDQALKTKNYMPFLYRIG